MGSAIINYHGLHDLISSVSHSSGKLKMKLQADQVSGEDPLSGLLMAVSCCVLMYPRVGGRKLSQVLSYRGSTLMTCDG